MPLESFRRGTPTPCRVKEFESGTVQATPAASSEGEIWCEDYYDVCYPRWRRTPGLGQVALEADLPARMEALLASNRPKCPPPNERPTLDTACRTVPARPTFSVRVLLRRTEIPMRYRPCSANSLPSGVRTGFLIADQRGRAPVGFKFAGIIPPLALP